MQDFPHHYSAQATGRPLGTIATDSGELTTLGITAPKEFDGPGDEWSPEDLLVASVAACLILTFRAVSNASKLEWTELICEAKGTLDRVDKVTKFTQIHINAALKINPNTDKEKALRLLEKAEKNCLVSNSLTAQIHLDASISFA